MEHLPNMLGGETLIPLGAAVVVVVALVPLLIRLIRRLDDLTHEVAQLRRSLRRAWSAANQRQWELELANRNRDLIVPDSRQIIQVDLNETRHETEL